jgi:hypothetical protein
MLRKDFIERQFEEFGKVLALILGYKKNNSWEEFEQEIARAAKKFTSFEMEHVENLNGDVFDAEIIGDKSLLYDQRKILANLLFEKMNYYLEKGNDEKFRNLKGKCFKLYRFLETNHTQNEFDLDVHYKLEMLKKF